MKARIMAMVLGATAMAAMWEATPPPAQAGDQNRGSARAVGGKGGDASAVRGLRSAAPVVRPPHTEETLLRSVVVAEMPSPAIFLLLTRTATLSGAVRAVPRLARLP
jgi:hypothetical protein